MGFEPMTSRTPGGCSTNWATRTLKGARPLTGFCRWYMDCDLPTAGSTSPKCISSIAAIAVCGFMFIFHGFKPHWGLGFFPSLCMFQHPASRDFSHRHKERDERETSANSRSIFWSCRRPETWTYQSGLKLVWRLCSHATTATAGIFVRLRTRCHATILSADLLPNLQSRPDVPEKIRGRVFKYCGKSCPSMILWNLFDQSKVIAKSRKFQAPRKLLYVVVSRKDTIACLPTADAANYFICQ